MERQTNEPASSVAPFNNIERGLIQPLFRRYLQSEAVPSIRPFGFSRG